MRRSVSLAAYRALSWRGAPGEVQISDPRPPGQLLWCHAASSDRVQPLHDLIVRLSIPRPDLNHLVTCDTAARTGEATAPEARTKEIGSDHPAAVRGFLDHWKPDLCLWAGAAWMPNLITMAADRGTAMVLADLGESDLLSSRRRWMPDLTRACLDRFDTILLSDADAAGHLRRMGFSADRFSVQSRLQADANPAPCSEDDRSQAAGMLRGRPLWLAAKPVVDEIGAILSAHREALRFQHRLLLVVALADHKTGDALVAQLEKTSLQYDNWEPGDPVPPDAQVLLTDQSHLGLWYRLSPLTFMGGSLVASDGGYNPLEATALGSAVLYGPNVPTHLDAYMRLSSAGGARMVRSGSGLAACVIELVSPEKAARMALAGWRVVTESAGLTDQLTDLIQDRLDQMEIANARA